jgi:hypothetical protein
MLSLLKKSPCSYEDHDLSDCDPRGQRRPQEAHKKRPVIAKHQEGQGHQSEAENGDSDNPGREIFETLQKGDHRAYLKGDDFNTALLVRSLQRIDKLSSPRCPSFPPRKFHPILQVRTRGVSLSRNFRDFKSNFHNVRSGL